MGLLTLLDSRSHRNSNLWKEIIRFAVALTRSVSWTVER